MPAIKIQPDGVLTRLDLPTDGTTLSWLYQEIGCDLVDCIGLPHGLDFWIDDEGLYSGAQANLVASLFALMFGDLNLGHPIMGTVIVAKHDDDGNTIALDNAEYAAFLLTLRAMVREIMAATSKGSPGVIATEISPN